MKKVFLIGVGGIGVSSIAQYLSAHNYEIQGSDLEENENVKKLKKEFNLKFFSEHEKKNIAKDIEFLIYSPAVLEDSPERVRAKELGIKEYSYPEFLGKISEESFTISVAGTNGKTTTTTMLAEVLDNFQKSPTVVVGGVAKKFNSNFILGKSDMFIVESCEYKDSFLNLHPNIIAITNITPDHLDHFGNFENYKKVFLKFLDKAKGENKILICNRKDENLKELLEKAKKLNFKIIDYKKYQVEKVSIPGEYNRENAQVVLAIADILKLDLRESKEYLAEKFIGPARRFDYLGINENNLKIYNDYAHNPEGMKALLSAVKEKYPEKKNILIFQPHLFSRTEDFFDEFVETISKYDIIYLLPIYQARENPNNFSISSKKLFEKIKEKNSETFFCPDLESCKRYIKNKKYNEDFVLVGAGAGDVYKIGKSLVK